ARVIPSGDHRASAQVRAESGGATQFVRLAYLDCAGQEPGARAYFAAAGAGWLQGRRWCPGEDSNLHGSLHWYLKPARLPIPPPGQGWESRRGVPGRGAQSPGGIPGGQKTASRDEINQENEENQAFRGRA